MPGGMLPPLVLELKAKAGEFHSEMKKAQSEVQKTAHEAEKSGESFSRAGAKFQGAAKAITFGAVGAGVAIIGFGVEAATSAEKVDAQLGVALKNAGTSMEEMEPTVQALDTKMRQLGYTNVETNKALSAATTALGDPKKALQDLAVATDLARVKNIPLAQASILVAKAMEGQTRPLKALGIDLPVLAGGQKAVMAAQTALNLSQQKAKTFLSAHADAVQKSSKYHLVYMQMLDKVHGAQARLSNVSAAGGKILDALKARVKGSADAYGKTLAGQIAIGKAQLDQFGEVVGKAVIPIITKAAGIFFHFAEALMSNKPALIAIAAIIGVVLVTAIATYVAGLLVATATSIASFGAMIAKIIMWTAVQLGATGATEGVTAAQWLLNAALSANPIGLIVLGVIALIAIFVLAYKHLTFFRNLFNAVFHFIGAVVGNTIGWIKGHWQLMLAILIGPVGLAILWVKNNWSKVTGYIGNIVSKVKSVLSTLAGILTAPFRLGFDAIAGLWNNTIGRLHIHIPSIFGFGGFDFSMPKLPILDQGGIVSRPTLALLAANSRPEMVAPLSDVGGALGSLAPKGSGMEVHYHAHISGNNFVGGSPADARRLAKWLWPQTQSKALQDVRRNGFSTLTGQPA